MKTKGKRKVHSLTGRITPDLMREAFKKVKGNRGAAGVDKVSVNMFAANLDDNLNALMRDLKRGTFVPSPLRRKHIPKSRTKTRPLGIPVVKDRVAQEVVRLLIDPVFRPMFHDNSFGFIEGRNCHQAIEELLAFHAQGHQVVVDADITGFFDNIPHHVIMRAVASEVADGNILRLIESFLKSGVMEDGVFKPTTIGTPQGGVISPLLANIVLNSLDWWLHGLGARFARYADDFVIVCRSKARAEEALKLTRSFLREELELELNPDKTTITTYGKGYSFLGFRLSATTCRMRDKSVEKLKDKVRTLTVRKHNLDSQVIEELNRVLSGTANYFVTRFSNCQRQFARLDAWIRMRLRCMKFKRKSIRDNYRLRRKHFRSLGFRGLADHFV